MCSLLPVSCFLHLAFFPLYGCFIMFVVSFEVYRFLSQAIENEGIKIRGKKIRGKSK